MKTNELVEAAESVDRFLRTLQGLVELSKVLKDTSSVVNAGEEAEKRTAKLREDLAVAQAAITEAEASKASIIEQAFAERERLLSEAQAMFDSSEALATRVAGASKVHEDKVSRDTQALDSRDEALRIAEANFFSREKKLNQREAEVAAREAAVSAHAQRLREAAAGVS